MRLPLVRMIFTVGLISTLTALALTDYERDLQAIDADLARAKAVAPAESRPNLRLVDLLFRRASLTQALPDLREAWTALRRISEQMGPARVALARARIALDLHLLPEAKSALDAAYETGHDRHWAWLAFDLAMQSGNYTEANRIVKDWEHENARADDLARLAELASFYGDDARADALLARAEEQATIKEMRLFAWMAMRRGMLKFRVGDLDAARSHYTRAAKAYSGWWKIQQRQAELKAAEGHFAEAEGLYRQLMTSHAKPDIEQELGDLLRLQGRHREAEECYRRCEDAFVESAKKGEIIYLHHLASLYTEGLGNTAEAIRWARADLAIRDNASTHDALAWACYRAGDFSNACAEAVRVIATGTRDPHMLSRAETILAAGYENTEAAAIETKPSSSWHSHGTTFHTHP